jgi:gamma-tubulin complex component 5
MDMNPSWTDFHFLNTAFGDVVEASSTNWIKLSLVRLSYRGSKDKAVHRTVRALEGLLAEYAVPFPLTFIFGPRILQVYDSIFIFLLQIRRAKTVLERILVRGATAHDSSKAFYAMRGKLSWFVK